MSETRVYFNGTVDDLFEFVTGYLKDPSTSWPEGVTLGPLGPWDRTEGDLWLTFVELRYDATGAQAFDGPRVGRIDIERVTDHQAVMICRPLTGECGVLFQALARRVAEVPGERLEEPDTHEPTQSGEAAGETSDLTPLERKIIDTVHKIWDEGQRATDELVALRLPVVNPRTGEPYSRKTINKHPLLEEEGHIGGQALIPNVGHPLLLDRSCARSGLPTHNHPVYPAQVQVRQRSQQRLQRELHFRPRLRESRVPHTAASSRRDVVRSLTTSQTTTRPDLTCHT